MGSGITRRTVVVVEDKDTEDVDGKKEERTSTHTGAFVSFTACRSVETSKIGISILCSSTSRWK